MNNKELQELLKECPDDALVVYFHPTKSIQMIDHLEEIKVTKPNGDEVDALSISFTSLKFPK